MKSTKVTDPAILAQLNGSDDKVTDPALLAQLNGEPEEDPGAYLDSLPQEKPWWQKIPRNIAIGLTHLGRNIHNAPHDLVAGIERGTEGFGKTFEQLPGGIANKGRPISSYLPYDTESYADVFGQKGEGTMLDKLIQKGVEYAPEIAGGGSLLRGALRKYPLTQKMAGKPLREAQKQVIERSIPAITGNEELTSLINKSRPYLDNTRETKIMLEDALGGQHEPLFSLQSQLGKESRSLQKSVNASERRVYKEPQELKQDILNHMESHLRNQGHADVADLLRNGVRDYRHYIKMRDEVYPVLRKLGIPTSLFGSLLVGKKAFTKFIKD